jgi:glyoxylase-like metal-dependent hydrolase (beta-lactamase superfamily II)
MHTDHYGLAGTLLRLGQMRLLMHRLDWLFVDTHMRDHVGLDRDVEAWLARNGFEMPDSDAAKRAMDPLYRLTIVAPDTQIEDGDRIALNGSACTVVWTPGHTLGHVCLHSPEQRFLISGDHVLDPITPNVSMLLEEMDNPLGHYVASLRKVAALEADVVLPAHGEPFEGLQRRVGELLEHHVAREEAILDALRGRWLSGGDVARALPWTRRGRRFDELADGQQGMAVSETLSHLELLWTEGRVTRADANAVVVYTLGQFGTAL